MEIKVIGTTKEGYIATVEEMINLGGHSAGICYMAEDYENLKNEPRSVTQKRVDRTINSGHHSVYDHPTINLLLVGIPKIVAMVLNNEKNFSTSEKSARYTKMKLTETEQKKYDKWMDIFYNKIKNVYADMKDDKMQKLAQENARYLTSVFTPTTMEYTTSLRQLNYIVYMMKNFISNAKEDNTSYVGRFNKKIKSEFVEFIDNVVNLGYFVENLDCSKKNRNLSIFSSRIRKEEFGENYSVNYKTSFACLAQLQRHRTLSYEYMLDENPIYFVPLILQDDEELVKDWLKDISENKENFPQGILINVNERGLVENLVLKGYERLCYEAQLEIMLVTAETIERYYKETIKNDLMEISLELENIYKNKARCNLPGFKCSNPCRFGNKQVNRKI